jgi:hypothetical protein
VSGPGVRVDLVIYDKDGVCWRRAWATREEVRQVAGEMPDPPPETACATSP